MSKPESFYWSKKLQRTLEDNKNLCKNKKDHYGCINPPLLDIPIENVKVDELHLLLRITGNIYTYTVQCIYRYAMST